MSPGTTTTRPRASPSSTRIATAAVGVMGLFAAMLAVTGVFGMAMYSVSKRFKEFGIRVALGRPLIILLTGSSVGLLLGALASKLLAYIVYEATPYDPVVLIGVMLTMVFLGLLATWIPAHRTLHVNPARLLREE